MHSGNLHCLKAVVVIRLTSGQSFRHIFSQKLDLYRHQIAACDNMLGT